MYVRFSIQDERLLTKFVMELDSVKIMRRDLTADPPDLDVVTLPAYLDVQEFERKMIEYFPEWGKDFRRDVEVEPLSQS